MMRFRTAFWPVSVAETIPARTRNILLFCNMILFLFLYIARIFMMVPWLLRLGGTGTTEENVTFVLVFAFVQAVFDAAMINLLACYFASLKVDSPVLRAVMRRSIVVAIWTIPVVQVVGSFQWR